MLFDVKRGDEDIACVDGIEQTVERSGVGHDLPGLMQVCDAGEVLQVVELAAHEREACLYLRHGGERLGLSEVCLQIREQLRRVKECDELKGIGDRLARACIGGQRFKGPHVIASAEVVGVERDSIKKLILKAAHVEDDAFVHESGLAKLGDEVFGVVVLRIVELRPIV